MEHTGTAKTALFERALGIGLGIFDVVCDVTPTESIKSDRKVDKPKKKSNRKKNTRRDN